MVAAACVYPLETVKSLLTVERGRYGEGIIESLKTFVEEQGFCALYRGLVPTLMAMFPYVGVEFCTYETCRSIISSGGQRMTTIETMSLGALAGMVAQISCHPLDVVRKRLQLRVLVDVPRPSGTCLTDLQAFPKQKGGVAFTRASNRLVSPPFQARALLMSSMKLPKISSESAPQDIKMPFPPHAWSRATGAGILGPARDPGA